MATVSDSGLVTAVADGTATITAKSWYGHEAVCAVTVKPPDEPAPPEPVDPLEAAKQTMCPLKKYDGRTLGELVMLDPGFLKWLATKYQNDEHPEIPAAARLICEHALKTA